MKTLIKGGWVIDPANAIDGIKDILMENGVIKTVSADLNEAVDEVIDASGLYVLPGLVDMHCHLREPGFEYKEDIETGTKAAAKGGFTAVACMPNTNPIVDNDSVVKYIVDKASRVASTRVYPIGSITKGAEGHQLAEMGFMKEAGAVAVSDDGKPVESSDVMRKAMEYSKDFGLLVISHCEDMKLSEGGTMNEGFLSTSLGLKGIPSLAEEIQVARDVLLSEYTGVPVHIAHISTGGSARIIREAKKRGVRVTCETCPHYFSLTEDAVEGFDTNAKVNPPLRGENDRLAIIEAIKDGTVDAIATDHAPHHRDEKNVEFQYASNGISGFETAYSAAYTYLVEPGYIKMDRLAELMSINPSRLLGKYSGGIKAGASADITIVDNSAKVIVNSDEFVSKGKNSPFSGKPLKGCIKFTIMDGIVRYREGE